MFGDCVAIRHARDVVRDDAGLPGLVLARGTLPELLRQRTNVGQLKVEQLAHDPLRPPRHLEFLLVRVEVLLQEALERQVPLVDLVRKRHQSFAGLAHVQDSGRFLVRGGGGM